MEIGFIIVMAAIVAICYLLVMHHQDRKKEENKGTSRRNECCNCKHFQKVQGSSTIGTCTFFFKSFKPWNPACHRWEKKGGGDED